VVQTPRRHPRSREDDFEAPDDGVRVTCPAWDDDPNDGEKAVDLVMNAQQGAAEGLGAGGAPGAGAGIQGKDSSSEQPRPAAKLPVGCPAWHDPPWWFPVVPVARAGPDAVWPSENVAKRRAAAKLVKLPGTEAISGSSRLLLEIHVGVLGLAKPSGDQPRDAHAAKCAIEARERCTPRCSASEPA
jgi:hypothetical protein